MLYSFKVTSSREVDLTEHLITIGEGLDAFTVRTDDVKALKNYLAKEGVQVLECTQLDALEPVVPDPQIADTLRCLQGELDGQSLLGGEDNSVE